MDQDDDVPRFGVYLGLDVGKQEHHACALSAEGKRLHDKALPQDEAKLRDLFRSLSAKGRVLVVVDQPASIVALAVTVARAEGIDIAYLPGLSMRRIADLHPGNSKTDARDAYVIAEAARTMPHALRRVDGSDEALADLEVIVGFDDDLATEVTRITNRIRGLLTQIHPALERAIGPHIQPLAGVGPTERDRSRAPGPPNSCCPSSPTSWLTCSPSAPKSRSRSRTCWRHTLFPRS